MLNLHLLEYVNNTLKQLKFIKYNEEDLVLLGKIRRMLSIQKGGVVLPVVIDLDYFTFRIRIILPHQGKLFTVTNQSKVSLCEQFIQK
jgi:hypothetical protein